MNKRNDKHALIDRFAIAFLSGLIAFITGVIVWCLVLFLSHGMLLDISNGSFKIVLYFTVLMTVLGFFMMENILINIFSKIWDFLYKIFRQY